MTMTEITKADFYRKPIDSLMNSGVTLPPAPMTQLELTDWLAMRGVERDSADMSMFLREYADCTLDDMDEQYAALHGDMA